MIIKSDVFTAVEFGPFNIVGHEDPLLCQVSFYTDGEIQVQYWNLNRRNAYLVSSRGQNFAEKDYIGYPYVYTVGKKITLTRESRTETFAKNEIFTHRLSEQKRRNTWRGAFPDGCRLLL